MTSWTARRPRRGAAGRDVALRRPRLAPGPRRARGPEAAAPAGREPAGQRLPPQPGRRDASWSPPRPWRRLAARGRRRRAGHPGRRPGPGVRAVRDARGHRGGRRDRPRPRHRPLGDRPARRHHPVRRPRARPLRRPGARRPSPHSRGARDDPARAVRGTTVDPPTAAARGPPARAGAHHGRAVRPVLARDGSARKRPGRAGGAGGGCAGRGRLPGPRPGRRDLPRPAGRRWRGARGGSASAGRRSPSPARRCASRWRRRRSSGTPSGSSCCACWPARRCSWRASSNGRTLQGFVLGWVAWPLACLRCLPWFGRSLQPVAGLGRSAAALRTAALSVLAVLVFGLLFASADALFAEWVDVLVPDLRVDTFVARAFLTVFVGGVVLAASYLALNPPSVESTGGPTRPVAQRYEWLVPVLLVDAVFVVFLVAQATVIFGGHDYLEQTTGLTYAEYVHQGFGQLTVATALTLLVVWAAARKAPARDRRGPPVAARVARPAVRPDPGGRRVRALPDARLPGGVRLHRAAPARRRLRGLARAPRRPRARRGRHAEGGLAATHGPPQRGRCAARDRRAEPGRLGGRAQPRPVRRDRQDRLGLPPEPLG